MPELPEVETTCRAIAPVLINKKIVKIITRCPRLRLPINDALIQQSVDQTIIAVYRRAKYLILKLTAGFILIHLGMSGHLRVVSRDTKVTKHDHIDLLINDTKILRYNDPRRFGLWLYLTELPEQHRLLENLGPEPLLPQFDGLYLFNKAKNKKQPVKSFIMSNEIVVGVGNIYATESLFYAKLNPQTEARQVSLQQYQLLASEIKKVLVTAIEVGGTTLKNFFSSDGKPGYFSHNLQVYGRKGGACAVCGFTIEMVKIAGRSTTFCPQCQPKVG